MSTEDFYSADFRDVMDAIKGYNERERLRFQNEWERTRWLATIGIQPYAGKGKKIKMTDLIQFDWEKTKKPKERIVTENQKEFRQRMDEWMRKQHGKNQA